MTQNLPWSIFTATVNGMACVIADFRRGLTGGITESLRDIVVACFMVPLYTLPKAPSPCSSSRDTRSLSTSQWSIINALFLAKENNCQNINSMFWVFDFSFPPGVTVKVIDLSFDARTPGIKPINIISIRCCHMFFWIDKKFTVASV